jgi:DMSO/TMAO reductase YedYZ molybdopterin-dependent catalytic subunit
MRRRNMIVGAGAGMMTFPAAAAEATRLPSELPAGTRQIAHFVNLPDKQRMLRLSDRPPNYATPLNVFTEAVTPNDRFFVRYHLAGVPSAADMEGWSLSIVGNAVDHPVQLKMRDLLDLPFSEVLAVNQCAGNRRGLTIPHVAGVQWDSGAMGCAVWRGPRLREVLKAAGLKPEALEVRFAGTDKPLMEGTPAFEKSLPIEKALDPDTIVAIAMNDAPLPLLNGNPARLVVPGWTGTYWMKHLTRIEVAIEPLANFWMKAAYRVPAGMFPVDHPFRSQATETTVPITELVVNSLIADPLDGAGLERAGYTIRGVAWDRGAGIGRVEVSLDGGRNWQDALLDRPLGRYAFRRFSLQTGLMRAGTYQFVSRATSQSGERQAMELKANPGGYHNNVPRPVSVIVT